MRGVQHNVIEINDTQNSEIEKILVFLRPGQHKITVANTRKEAQDILQRVKIKKATPNIKPLIKNKAVAIVGILILTILTALFLL